jgi:hypothetical protein
MNKSTAIAVACGFAAFVVADQTALAQAGSTGGTVGKTDKSASGGEESTRPNNASRPTTRSGCSAVAGTWLWKFLDQSAVVTLNAGGTSHGSDGNTGRWTCTGRTVVIHWTRTTDTMVLSSGGKSLAGSSAPSGVSVTGTRM